MKKVLLLLFLILSACTNSQSQPSSYLLGKSKKECPKGNPYIYGSGHYAGYEWAQNNDVSSCGGNSSSFTAGCEEWISQQNCNEDD